MGFRFGFLLFFSLFLSAQAAVIPPRLQTGDLLFLNLNCGEFCQAVVGATKEQLGNGPDFNHLGIVQVRSPSEIFVLEAVSGPGVIRTPYADLLKRLGPKAPSESLVIGRIRPNFRSIFEGAVTFGEAEIGKPYNPRFSYRSEGYYCSQFIARMVAKANGGKSLFTYRPMFFGRANSRARQLWSNYFKARGSIIPEGELGVSPLGMYLEGKGKFFD